MDFGLVGFEGLENSSSNNGFICTDPESKYNKWFGSGLFKHERSSSSTINEDDYFTSSKIAKINNNDHGLTKSTTSNFFSDHQSNMLSFSAPKQDTTTTTTLPYFNLTPTPTPTPTPTSSLAAAAAAYSRNSGQIINEQSYEALLSMHGYFPGARGPFTPSQWMELEHQALIYKYITANVPIPSNLLIPIRKALDSAGFSSFTGGLLRPSNVGWGGFHLGFSHNNDPEPGRCRRTDGKKWRCARDAVADHKYCERHMNRGRHRSRKPVEGTAATSKPLTTSKVGPTVGGSGKGAASLSNSNNHAIGHQQQLKNIQTSAMTSNQPGITSIGSRMQNTSGLSASSDLKFKENTFMIPKQHFPVEESMTSEFGLVSSYCLLNPSHKTPSLMDCRNFGSSNDLTEQERESHHPLRQFMDDWPKNQSDRSAISWAEVDVQSDRTQLSISIPRDFMSSTSSPINDKVTLSPLKLSHEFDPIQMGLGVGSVIDEQNQREANWMTGNWESSMGGPLGEVLHSTSSSAAESKNSSALNLMTEGWEKSPRLGSSPTGVLQKIPFGSLSNSSAGSSPRAENNNKTHEGASLNSTPGS
ncbi:hypothetical protein ACFE04_005722 [Oxalis oulophora]